MLFLILKTAHILGAIFLFGTGLGSVYYLIRAHFRKNVLFLKYTLDHVIQADYWITYPAALLQPLTGLWMAHLMGYDLKTGWPYLALVLYVLIGFFYIPAVFMQFRMRRSVEESLGDGTSLRKDYHTAFTVWLLLGIPSFLLMLFILYLMVFRPIS